MRTILSPDYLYNVSDRVIELYEQLNSFVVRDICRRLVNADFQFTGSIDWQLYKLQESGMLLDDIVAEVAKLTNKSEKEIAEIFTEATYTSQTYDNEVYKAAGITPIDIKQSPQMLKILQATYEQTLGELRNFTNTTASVGQTLFMDTMDEMFYRVMSGQQSYSEAIRQAIEKVAAQGITVRYPSGHTDTIETAVRRCVMTGVGQATARISVQNAKELDTDLVLVSSHLGARPSHAEWQGKVFSISGNSKKYAKLSEATGYGTVKGLCGANCRHHFTPYIEGISHNPYEKFDSKENQERYDNQQEQRRQERNIRTSKRELQALKESIDATKDDKVKFALQQEYDRKAARLKAQNNMYEEFSQRVGLPTQKERLQVAGWGNRQAGSARAAARRYEDSLKIDTGVLENIENTAYNSPKGIDLSDWKSKAVNTTPEQDIVLSNINLNKEGYSTNCQRCVPAYEMRRRGYDVTAKPITEGKDIVAENWQNIFEDATWISCTTGNGLTQIKHLMHKYGDGARAEVYVEWSTSMSHVFIAEQRNGKTVFLDPQDGKRDASDYFKYVVEGKTAICRIDNLEPSELIKECCEEYKYD